MVPIDESQGMTSVNPDDSSARMPAYQEMLSIESQRLNLGSHNKRGLLRRHPMLGAEESAVRLSLAL